MLWLCTFLELRICLILTIQTQFSRMQNKPPPVGCFYWTCIIYFLLFSTMSPAHSGKTIKHILNSVLSTASQLSDTRNLRHSELELNWSTVPPILLIGYCILLPIPFRLPLALRLPCDQMTQSTARLWPTVSEALAEDKLLGDDDGCGDVWSAPLQQQRGQ